MKEHTKGVATGVLTTCLILGITTTALAATGAMTITVDPVNIQVNGATFLPKNEKGEEVPVFAYDGTTYAPLRALAEAYGLEVGYDAGTNMATVREPAELNGSTSTVEEGDVVLAKEAIAALKTKLKNPESLQIHQIRAYDPSGGHKIEIEYSAMNGFGGYNKSYFVYPSSLDLQLESSPIDLSGLPYTNIDLSKIS